MTIRFPQPIRVNSDRALFAVPKKGRLHDQCVNLLKEIGLNYQRDNRLDIAHSTNYPITFIFLNAKDIPAFVSEGNVDFGIVGQDVIQESGCRSIIEEINLGFGKCRLAVEAPIGKFSDVQQLVGARIVTSFPSLTRRFFAAVEESGGKHFETENEEPPRLNRTLTPNTHSRLRPPSAENRMSQKGEFSASKKQADGNDERFLLPSSFAETSKLGFSASQSPVFSQLCTLSQTPSEASLKTTIHTLSGSVEASVALGLGDAVVDLVETGDTMRAAGLEYVATVLRTEAVLVSNCRCRHPDILDKLKKRIRSYLHAKDYIMVSYNVSRPNLESTVRITPGLKSPTITTLAEADWVAVSAIVPRHNVLELIDKLEKFGAQDILTFPFRHCRLSLEKA